MHDLKKDGIVLAFSRVSLGLFSAKILFSDSLFLTVSVPSSRFAQSLSPGIQVFGSLFVQASGSFFKVDSVGGFLPSAFWDDPLALRCFLLLIQVFLKIVPENLCVFGLYSKFLECTEAIIRHKKEVSADFRLWVLESIS